LDEIKLNRAPGTIPSYRTPLSRLQSLCPKDAAVSSVDWRATLIKLLVTMKAENYSDRTCHNAATRCKTFLKQHGITVSVPMPRPVNKVVDAYSRTEIQTLFAAAKPSDRLLFELFLFSGLREGEISHLTYDDLNFERNVLKVSAKGSWRPKTAQERIVPLPASLMSSLLARRDASRCPFVFPNKFGMPDGHLLARLKRCAAAAGQDPANWNLHKFRRSYASLLHEGGASITKCAKLLGHANVTTTQRYLHSSVEDDATRAQIETTFGGL
jgi:integrase